MSRKFEIIERQIEPLGETLYTFTLSCGLPVEMIRKRGFTKKFVSYSVDFGSDDISFIRQGDIAKTVLPFGTAHFLEHKMFEQKNTDAMSLFSAMGVNSNAGTGHTNTTFYFTCTDNFEKSLKLLMKFITDPYINDENVKKERGIIAQEIKMYDDSPEYVCSFNMTHAMYKNNYARYDIAGKAEDIERIDADILLRAYESFYTPENSVLTVVADLEPEYVAHLLESMNLKFKGKGVPERIFPKEPNAPDEEVVFGKMSAAKTLFSIGYKDDEKRLFAKQGLIRRPALSFAIASAFGESSDFYSRLYGSGLINKAFGPYNLSYRTHAYSAVEGESDDPKKVLEEIQKEIERRIANGFEEDEIRRNKNDSLGSSVAVFNNPQAIGRFLGRLKLDGIDIFDFFDGYAKISREDVAENFRIAFSVKPVLSVIEPL